MQSSKLRYQDPNQVWHAQNRSLSIFMLENLLAHILLQLLSLILFIVYATNLLPPPSISLTGSPALRNFLITASVGGPGLWVLSQALLLLYFKMDNGSNVCGIEFNYNNKAEKNGEENDEGNKKEDLEEEKKD